MKRFIKQLPVLAMSLLLTSTACNKDSLNLTPLNEISDTDFWKSPKLVETFVNTRYNQLGHGWPESWMSSATDETFLTWGGRGTEPITQGFLNPSDLGRMNGGWYGWDNRNWNIVWGNIKDCNLFMEKIGDVVFTNDALRQRYIAEVRFIRAYMYFDLVQRWGAMPLITKTFTLDTDFSKVTRNTYKENVDFIVSECEQAAAVLPASYSQADNGRATKLAALALKSRMLLYAASPLMNKANVDPLVGYPSPDPDRWAKAATAAKEVLDVAAASGYGLFNKYPDVKTNYTQLFLEKGNPEIILDRQNIGQPYSMQYIDRANQPNGYDGWGGNTPIQEFVDDFETADGYMFDWNNPVHKANPYANRDPRLSAYVLYDGAPWKGRGLETHYKEVMEDGKLVLKGGRDTGAGPSPWNSSKTGYNVRKFMDESVDLSGPNDGKQNWTIFRLAEFYLNYAEAEYFAGKEGEARWGVNEIRKRAQMPDVTASGADLIQAIRHERRIELAFEEHRYFDIRRWMIAPEVMNKPATRVNITKKLDGTTVYEVHTDDAKTLVENRKFNEANYWLPIPLSEINKSVGLKQNPGYN